MTESQQFLLRLLCRALTGARGPMPPTPALSSSLWIKTIQEADTQEVLGLAFDALTVLDKEQQPSTELLMAWTAQVCSIERDYHAYKHHCLEGLRQLEDSRIPFVLMKGLLIANLYPKPEHRPIGDVDLYFVSKHYPSAIEFFKRQKSVLDMQHDSKHATAVYHGLNWELHFRSIYFFDYFSNRYYRRLENRETSEERLCKEAADSNYYVSSMPPVFRMIYLTAHIQHHLVLEEIKLRHIVDWMLVVKHNRTALAIGESQLKQQLNRLGLTRLYRALGYIATQHLGMDANSYAGCTHFSCREANRGEYLINIVLKGHIPGCQPYQARTPNESFTTKARLFGELLKRCFKLWRLVPREAMAAPFGILRNAVSRRMSRQR